jgi:hypothetical protein
VRGVAKVASKLVVQHHFMEKYEQFSREELKSQLVEIEQRIRNIEPYLEAAMLRSERYPEFADPERQLQALEEQKKQVRSLLERADS